MSLGGTSFGSHNAVSTIVSYRPTVDDQGSSNFVA